MAQVSHQSRDEPEAPGVTVVETPASKDEHEAPEVTVIETPASKDGLGAPQMTPVETLGSRSELDALQNTQVDTPSLYFLSIHLNSTDYPHSAPSDKQWSFYIISQCMLRPFVILDLGLHLVLAHGYV